MKTSLTPKRLNADHVINLVMSAPAEYESGEAEVIIDKAIKRLDHIEANGLRVCRHANGALRGFVLTTLNLDPYTMGRHIDCAVNKGYFVDDRYYGAEGDPRAIEHGFTEADLGSVFFLAESADISKMPGHLPNLPGSICADMQWDSERNETFRAFCEKFAAAGEGRAVNYLSHSLIYAHDMSRKLFDDTLGHKVGGTDYIQMPYDAERSLCPYGYVLDCKPSWWTRDTRAVSYIAATFLVR